MPRTKRSFHATASETTTPPDSLPASQTIARVVKAAGNNLYSVELPQGRRTEANPINCTLVEMPARFRSSIWVKKGSYVLVDLSALDQEGVKSIKVGGEITNVVREEKKWRAMPYWPSEFVKTTTTYNSGDEEESVVGKMPPSDSSDDET